MEKNLTKPKKSVVEGDEYFYRHPEMMRVKIESESQIEEKQKDEE